MSTRRTEFIIRDARADTGNNDYSATSGISQSEIAGYINQGQERLQALILREHPQGAFVVEGLLNTVAQTESVTLPADMLFEGGVVTLEYSATGQALNYYHLVPAIMRERLNQVYANPTKYIRRQSAVLLNPIPPTSITNALRLNYIQRLPRVDVRRGQVSAVSLNTGASTITSLTLTTGATLDSAAILEQDFICVVDVNGAFKMKDIPVTAVNTGTGALTIAAGYTFAAGETISVGDYVVSGLYTTSHSQLPMSIENYLKEYAIMKILKRDSNNDISEAAQLLKAMEDDIVAGWSELNEEVHTVPMIQTEDF